MAGYIHQAENGFAVHSVLFLWGPSDDEPHVFWVKLEAEQVQQALRMLEALFTTPARRRPYGCNSAAAWH